MPPKAAPSKKAIDKQVKKTVEDKTFGLKNKNKSAKVQKYVATVKKTVDEGLKKKASKLTCSCKHKQKILINYFSQIGKPAPDAPLNRKTKAELEAEKKAELAQLFKITQARVPPGKENYFFVTPLKIN